MMLKYIFLLQNTHENNEILAVTNQLCPENFVY